MGWRDGTTIPLDYGPRQAPAFGEDARLDALAHVTCEYGGHIPHHHPERAEDACQFHRRLAMVQLEYVDQQVAAATKPCDSERNSWEIFSPQGPVDSYWMQCHRVGPHDEHENSETGATWRDSEATA